MFPVNVFVNYFEKCAQQKSIKLTASKFMWARTEFSDTKAAPRESAGSSSFNKDF